MGRLSIVLVEQRAMARQSLVAWFQHNCHEMRLVALADPAELCRRSRPIRDVDIVIFSVGHARVADGEVLQTIERLKHVLGELPLVLLSDREEMGEVVEAIRRGARGFIPTSLDLDDAVEALRFVSAGGTFVPARSLMRFAENRQTPAEEGAPSADRQPFGRLTPRELEVLARLRQGKPNKVIAHELEISESTVKVFVRRILMKLRAMNRTEVVYLTHRQFDEAEADLV
jgi:DNA-binding NarL/FixJ family response regulator